MKVSKNPEKEQDRVFDTYDHFHRFGQILFPQQRTMYNNIAAFCEGRSVLEVGCGAGVGSAVLERKADLFMGTDKSKRNVEFARQLYPWISFSVWDINEASGNTYDIVVGIEVIEHVRNTDEAICNLIRVANQEVWISSPDGRGKPRPPSNEYHVCEYTPQEMFGMILDCLDVTIEVYNWETMELLQPPWEKDPLLYRIIIV